LLLLLGTAATATASESPQPRRLSSIITADALLSPAACTAVTFDDEITREGLADDAELRSSPNPGGRVPVGLAVYVIAVDKIDAREGSFRLKAYVRLVWCDPRLAVDQDEGRSEPLVYSFGAGFIKSTSIWIPGLFLPRQLGEPRRTGEQLTLHPDGTVEIEFLVSTFIAATYDFSRFPLDTQVLRIPVQSHVGPGGAYELLPDETLLGFDPEFEIPEWTVLETSFATDRSNLDDDWKSSPGVMIEIEIARKAGYYLWKAGLPLLLIVCVAWSVFWMTRDALAQRQRQSATGLLTLVAFMFVITGTLPRVPYLTLLDGLFLWSFLASASTLILNVWSSRSYRSDPERGLRFDRAMRWIFPLVYVAGAVLVFAWRLI
jgi:hypothetical protein